jgi:hypothetical protein
VIPGWETRQSLPRKGGKYYIDKKRFKPDGLQKCGTPGFFCADPDVTDYLIPVSQEMHQEASDF